MVGAAPDSWDVSVPGVSPTPPSVGRSPTRCHPDCSPSGTSDRVARAASSTRSAPTGRRSWTPPPNASSAPCAASDRAKRAKPPTAGGAATTTRRGAAAEPRQDWIGAELGRLTRRRGPAARDRRPRRGRRACPRPTRGSSLVALVVCAVRIAIGAPRHPRGSVGEEAAGGLSGRDSGQRRRRRSACANSHSGLTAERERPTFRPLQSVGEAEHDVPPA